MGGKSVKKYWRLHNHLSQVLLPSDHRRTCLFSWRLTPTGNPSLLYTATLSFRRKGPNPSLAVISYYIFIDKNPFHLLANVWEHKVNSWRNFFALSAPPPPRCDGSLVETPRIIMNFMYNYKLFIIYYSKIKAHSTCFLKYIYTACFQTDISAVP